ncbi:MAG: glycine--tRNA ligase subunit beta [Candidatus Aminicenantes bacterium]
MEFLLEISTEEMPASHVKSALSQLKEKFTQELSSFDVDIYKIQTLGTCRRLAVAGDFSPQQKDRKEEVIGPPKVVAFSPDGTPTSAALGFARSHGIGVDRLQVIRTEKGEYVGLRKVEKGKPTPEILQKIIPDMVTSLSFPKMMRWGEETQKFSRPIKNILCICNQDVIPFSVGKISSSGVSIGHKILSPQKIPIHSFPEYKVKLRENKVVVEGEQRRKMILSQISMKMESIDGQLLPDEELMEKIIYDVEYPYVFLGSFPKKYLALPVEILSTAMKKGQSLFSVVKGNQQLPYFIGVADNYKDTESLILKGNERVLIARLEDAKFFWEQDLKMALKERVRNLDRIVFQEKLGSYGDKVARLKKMVSYLSDKIGEPKIKKDGVQAAELAKSDLLTEMIKEFPSLQGKVGGIYAKQEGYPSPVWKAVYEHYQPLSLEDDSPSTATGAILSIADKIDSVVGAVGIGIQVTGSKDPFGLRRNAQGICKIILEKKFDFSFSRLLDKAVKLYIGKLSLSKQEIKDHCGQFFSGRLQSIYERQGYRYDLIKAALSADADNIYHSYLRLKALDNLKDSSHFGPMILTVKRVNNILRDHPRYRVNPDLFQEKEEKELYTTFTIIQKNTLPLISRGDFARAQRFIFRMRAAIDNFFDQVLVMTEDRKIRRNRLALLQDISKLFLKVADYSQVVVEGENK